MLMKTRRKGAKKQALVTNLMSVDAQRLQDNMTYMFSIVSGIYQIVVTMYLLYGQLGYAAFGGLGVMLIFLPVTQRIVLLTRDYQKVVLQYKDKRIKAPNGSVGWHEDRETVWVGGPSWEELKRLREKELSALWHYKLAGVFSRCVFAVVPTVVAVGTFSLYVLTGHELTVSRVYTTLALFNVLRFPLMMVPRAISSAVEALLSVDRIAHFLDAPEVSKLPTDNNDEALYTSTTRISGGLEHLTTFKEHHYSEGSRHPSRRGACALYSERRAAANPGYSQLYWASATSRLAN